MSEIKQIVEKNCAYAANTMSARRFPNPKNPLKMRRPFYHGDIVTAITYGKCLLIEALMKNHADDPYKDVDELLGDLQIIGASSMNKFGEHSTINSKKKYEIEDFMSGGVFVKNS